jgi:methylmalonyl-CoA mutase N-terminal domain/subunit
VRVNRFQQEDNRSIPGFRLDPALERAQVEKLQQVRALRSQTALDRRMQALEQAARDGSNLMPPIVDAAEAHATVGEISDCLRTVFGEYRE